MRIDVGVSKSTKNVEVVDQCSPNTFLQEPYKKIRDILSANTELVLLQQSFILQAVKMIYKKIHCSLMFNTAACA